MVDSQKLRFRDLSSTLMEFRIKRIASIIDGKSIALASYKVKVAQSIFLQKYARLLYV